MIWPFVHACKTEPLKHIIIKFSETFVFKGVQYTFFDTSSTKQNCKNNLIMFFEEKNISDMIIFM